ncbi:MAG: hypothetical protein ACRDIZ_10915 [Actinomycetota bacterium]
MSDAFTLSRTGLRFTIDTHIVDDPSPAVARLRELASNKEIQFSGSDRILVEIRDAGLGKREELESLAWEHDLFLGPFVLGHSELGRSVLPSDEDVADIRLVFSSLFPTREWSGARKQDIRDALHVQTSIRYARSGFITRDAVLLRAKKRVRAMFNGFMILTPEEAVVLTERRIKNRQTLEGIRSRPRRG